jgi:23S rRNA (guanine745-N1)-methyltransferase
VGNHAPAHALACTVRACGQPLTRGDRTWTCGRGHTFDVARSGYVNLLQPQDRKSASAGDSKASVDARARLLARGVGRALVQEVVEDVGRVLSDPPGPPGPKGPGLRIQSVVVELGSGSGDVLGELARARPIEGIGIDLSTAAAEHAAKRFPALTWVVANADRRLPLVDRSTSLVISIHGRRNPAECARVLKPGGWLVVAIPAPDDLVELREQVQGARVERDRGEALLAEHAPFFTLRERGIVRERPRLDRNALKDLLRGTYRGERRSAAAGVEALDELEVTLASDVFLLASSSRRHDEMTR